MCGIGGFVGRFDASLLADMQRRLAHRGPDGVGHWHDGNAGVGLVHRRLSIIDLSEAASQPMEACGGRYHIVFNGEIYNYKALVTYLKAKGYDLNPHSDTAVLGPLYDLHGPAMLDRLEGIFAFALWDAEARELFAARDHLGIKPLYYTETPHGFAFASELKALLGVKGLKEAVDPVALSEYLTFLWTPSARTMLAGVQKLRPGHWLKVRGEKAPVVEHGRWYTPPQARLEEGRPVYDPACTPAQLAGLVDEVVAEQCISDVPVGAFLSGGVDSSAVVASMCATGNRPARAYCISFGEEGGLASEGFEDDIAYARMVAESCGLDLRDVVVDAKGILARLPKLALMLDEPQADPAPLFVEDIARQARGDGIKVLMSGTGGDDVMTGYRRHLAARYRQRLGLLRRPAAVALGLGAGMVKGAAQRRARRMAELLRAGEEDFLRLAFCTNSQPGAYRLLRREWREQIEAREREEAPRDDLDLAAAESRGQDVLNRLLYAELFGFLPDHNLNYTDKAAMAAGVEVRVPLTDRRLLDFMAKVPPSAKIQGTALKAFFKQSQQGRLPEAVLRRSKTGFGAPVRRWLAQDGRAQVEETLFGSDNLARQWFDPKATGMLWQRTLEGRVDGAYTVLALCMAVWWSEGMASL